MLTKLKQRFKLAPDLGGVISRFPFPVLFMAVFTLIIMAEGSFRDDTLVRLLGGIVIAAYLSVSAVLAAEARGRKPSALLQIAFFAVIVPLAWFSETLHLNIPMAIGAAILLLGNAVIWRQARNDLHVWDFTHKLWTGAGFTVAGSLIYTWGLFAIMAALKSLFGIKIDNVMEHVLLPIGLGFLAPLYWLSSLPPVDEDYSDLYENPGFVSKAVSFMGTWLLAPLTLIYALILLAYGAKIVIAGELPKGEIAQLTSPFLIVGTLTWLALDPPFSSKNKLARLFKALWWPVSIPAALLLAVAVFVRIGEYGVTPQRLALLALVIWALGLALWFTVAPKTRRDIRFIPGFAATLLAVGAIGSGWLSQVNQGQRFETNLKASGVLSAKGDIAAPPVITDMEAAKRAKSAFQYLMQHNGKIHIAHILEGKSVEFDCETSSATKVLEALGLGEVPSYNRYSESLRTNFNRQNKPISIANYDTFYGPFHLYNRQKGERFLFSRDNISAASKQGIIYFDLKGEEIVFDFENWIDAQDLGYGEVSLKTPYVNLKETETVSFTLVVNSFSRVERMNGDEASVSAEFYVLSRGIE